MPVYASLFHLRQRIEAVMNQSRPGSTPSLAAALRGIAMGYGGMMRARATAYRRGLCGTAKLPCRVIAVGNITLGGTGKTPMTIHLAQLLKGMGYQVVVMSRGYKGGAEKHGGVVSDGTHIRMGPDMAGDEPFLMAALLKDVPVMVGRNRHAVGKHAMARFAPDVLILDDACQHLALARDLNLVLLDARHPLGNGYLFPRGRLREPPSALARADACILTRSPATAPPAAVAPIRSWLRPGTPIFATRHEPYLRWLKKSTHPLVACKTLGHLPPRPLHWLQGRRIYAFSGIAENADFRRSLERQGASVVAYQEFADHHAYTTAELDSLIREAVESGADCIATTEKDAARIDCLLQWPLDLALIGVCIAFTVNESRFNRLVRSIMPEFPGGPKGSL